MLNSPNYYIIQNLSLDSKQHIFICSNIFVAPFAHLCHIWAISKHTTQDKNLVKIIEEYLLLKLLCCFSATSSAGVVNNFHSQKFSVKLPYLTNSNMKSNIWREFSPLSWLICQVCEHILPAKMRKKSKLIVPPRSRWKVSYCHG